MPYSRKFTTLDDLALQAHILQLISVIDSHEGLSQ